MCCGERDHRIQLGTHSRTPVPALKNKMLTRQRSVEVGMDSGASGSSISCGGNRCGTLRFPAPRSNPRCCSRHPESPGELLPNIPVATHGKQGRRPSWDDGALLILSTPGARGGAATPAPAASATPTPRHAIWSPSVLHGAQWAFPGRHTAHDSRSICNLNYSIYICRTAS